MKNIVTVKLYGILRKVIRQTTVEVSPSATVRDVLDELCSEYPALQPHLFDSDGKIFAHIVILLDGQSVWSQRGLDTNVSPGRTLALVYPIEGG